jgi:hypothetical protein
MVEYFTEWGHTYLMHLGAWVSFGIGATVMKNGLPMSKEIPKIMLSCIILAAVVSVFSSHSHNHYLSHVVGKQLTVPTDSDNLHK